LASIYPNQGPPKISSYDFAWRLLATAEKFNIHKVVTRIRELVMTPSYLRDRPLEIYILARRHGWKEEAKLAATATLSIDIGSPCYFNVLKNTDAESLMRLINLHRRRRRGLILALNEWASIPWCANSKVGLIGHVVQEKSWDYLLYRLADEMEKCSKADSLRSRAFWSRLDLKNEWYTGIGPVCKKCRYYFNIDILMVVIIDILDRLPTTI